MEFASKILFAVAVTVGMAMAAVNVEPVLAEHYQINLDAGVILGAYTLFLVLLLSQVTPRR
jgi:hypothetical protein